ncbi:MAG: ABC transporter ATP-binding protein [Caldilineae bacterium]|nr:MAG: ABC transporter ATP-binding protein [Caldilineae bacterium]
MLRGQQVTKRFGGLTALNRVDFAIEPGQIVGLIGPNGSGKTTLFNVITGFYRPEEGRILFDGHDITGARPHIVARMGIGRTFQIVQPFQNMTALENVEIGVLYGQGLSHGSESQARAQELLDLVGLGHQRHTPVRNFTLAEKKRLEIARALSVRPRLLLLDEVFAGLNPGEVKQAIELIFHIRRELGLTLLIVEHVLGALRDTCERVIVLNYGQKIAEGPPEEVFNHPEVIAAYLGSNETH